MATSPGGTTTAGMKPLRRALKRIPISMRLAPMGEAGSRRASEPVMGPGTFSSVLPSTVGGGVVWARRAPAARKITTQGFMVASFTGTT